MELTFIGWIQIAIGMLILLRGSLRSAFAFLVISGLFGGSAAIVLPSLQGSSIPPTQLALLFVVLRIMSPSGGYLAALPLALRSNIWLVGFAIYGIATSYLAPRIFAGAIDVAPMRPIVSDNLFVTAPLEPTSQNITAAFYLFGTLLVAIAATILTRNCRRGTHSLITAGIWVGWAHVLLGIVVLAATGTPLESFFELFRNGGYQQVNQTFQGFVRMHGLFPESSAYADFGFAWFVLNAELWFRSERPRATGPLALALAGTLFFSTSSTAYVGLAGYLAWFVLRLLFVRSAVYGKRVAQFGAALMGILVLTSILMIAIPSLPLKFLDVVGSMTVGKSSSASAQQRLFWALQGWSAFKASFGLGIGPGSFRSSSFVMAVIGTTGVIGVTTFALYALRVFQPFRRSTYGRSELRELTIGGAFAVAAILSQVPAAVSSAKSDPGTVFAIFAGAAIGLRPRMRREQEDEASLDSGSDNDAIPDGDEVPKLSST